MKRLSTSERLLIEEMTQKALELKSWTKGLSIGELIKLIRSQLGMSQKILARRAGVPQSTISRIEQGQRDTNLSTLHKVLNALSADLILAPALRQPIETIRLKQARKMAEKHIDYLKGTMNLEKQQPDSRLIKELMKQEEERLLQGPKTKLWEE